jgi:hypothetical protein
MNALAAYIAAEGITETATMNLLQRRGICSDNCVTVADVGNAEECVAWLKGLEKGETE